MAVTPEQKAPTDVERADALDAARYRYLMRQMPCNIADLFGDCVAFDEVDEEIDAAIVLESEVGFPVPRVNGKD